MIDDYSRYVKIAIGNLMFSLAFVIITVPCGIINGGVTSMSMILHRFSLTGFLPVYGWYTVITLILIVACYIFLGKSTFFKSIFSCAVGTASFIAFSMIMPDCITNFIAWFSAVGANPLINIGLVIEMICGAVFVGCAYYLCLSNDATAVGSDTLALIIHRRFDKIPLAACLYSINTIVLICGLCTYGLRSVIMGIAFAAIQAAVLNALINKFQQTK